jgi:hypothetical protein
MKVISKPKGARLQGSLTLASSRNSDVDLSTNNISRQGLAASLVGYKICASAAIRTTLVAINGELGEDALAWRDV